MKRTLPWLLLLFISFQPVYGAAVLKGKVVLLNSGRAPVENARVTSTGVDPQNTDSAGFFQLTFPSKNPGNVVSIRIFKQGLEVVRAFALDGIELNRDPDDLLEIFMCPGKSGLQAKELFYGIAEKSINKTYEEKLKKLESMDSKEKESGAQRLEIEMNDALLLSHRIAFDFAMSNLDKAPDLFIEAFNYIKKENIQGAFEYLNDANFNQWLNRIAEEEKKPGFDPRKILEHKKQAADIYMLKARLAIILMLFDKAEMYYEKAIDIDPSNFENYFFITDILTNRGDFNKALEICKKRLSLDKPAVNDFFRSMFLDYSGYLNSELNALPDAEKYYLEALAIRRKLAETDPAYLPFVAQTLNRMGALYSAANRLIDVEKCLKEITAIFQTLAQIDPSTHLNDASASIGKLVNFYKRTKRPNDAEKSLTENLEVYRNLAAKNPDAFLLYMANILDETGSFYHEADRLDDAGKSYAEALGIYQKFADSNPGVYLPKIMQVFDNLGLLSLKTGRLEQAEKAYTEALNICRKLAEKNPAEYAPLTANLVQNLGIVFSNTGKYPEACARLQEAYEIRLKLSTENPYAFELDLCQTILPLVSIYISAPGACKPLEDPTSLLNRASEILKKHTDDPQAQRWLKTTEEFLETLKKTQKN